MSQPAPSIAPPLDSRSNHRTSPCTIVIFGASGDLTSRKLIPALYDLHLRDALPEETCVLGVSRTELSDDAWRDSLRPWVQEHAQRFDPDEWSQFAQRIFYQPGSATESTPYPAIEQRTHQLAQQFNHRGNVLFYLSVAPSLYEPVVNRLNEAGLVMEGKRWCSLDRDRMLWQRIIVEKPFGHDAESAASLNRALGRVFEEEAIYRIDHYLAKELVQNLLIFRFANTFFEPIWNHRYIDHVQITAAESVGIGRRAPYYDDAGAIRDMIQSHLLQVLALVAMEPPTSYTARHIRQEKIKVIDAIKPTPIDRLRDFAALGQYAGDDDEPAYHELDGVAEGTRTETYAAIKLHFDNWRWAGTPFYLRTGKRLAEKRTEIVLQFKHPPANLFRHIEPFASGGIPPANRIIISIDPHEAVCVRFLGKGPEKPGPAKTGGGRGIELRTVSMDFDYTSHFKTEPLDAYSTLLLDAMRGDQTLFKHRLEVESSWESLMPFLGPESRAIREGIHANYTPGSWGPAAADELLAQDGRKWQNRIEDENVSR
jgi:glucose-6-phosphate 1-dehydrogenase